MRGFDPGRFLSAKARSLDGSRYRLMMELTAKIHEPLDLSIGQPDFDVPEAVKKAAYEAIATGCNRYLPPQGLGPLVERLEDLVAAEFPQWRRASKPEDPEGFSAVVTSGVSGGLLLACLSVLEPGDDVLIPDPSFMSYAYLARLVGATPVRVNTYPDFRLDPARMASAIGERTKMLILNSPSNPTGVVLSEQECRSLAELAESADLLILSDEIYDDFCYAPVARGGRLRAPSIATFTRQAVVLRGFSKSYGMPGWRLGYAAGPAPIVEKMTQLGLLTHVCAPSLAQHAALAALELPLDGIREAYRRRRDRVVERLSGVFEMMVPEGAFYGFARVPGQLGLTGTQFVAKAMLEHRLLLLPGSAFSEHDTHFRLSYACPEEVLDHGLETLLAIAAAGSA